ncbi:MAG: protease complex subunit PrcB family protein [Bacillota bacterium]|nr:protease complex subunit PrcB family protein [Bacillota bacterium]
MGKKLSDRFHRPSGKTLIVLGAAVAILAAAAIWLFLLKGEEEIEFTVLEESQIPQEITAQVIPEYRTLERALACKVGETIYVLATRGEKTSSGYDINISKMVMVEEDGKTSLVVYAEFTDPESGASLTQTLTYPLQVAATELTELPDSIELKVRYAD